MPTPFSYDHVFRVDAPATVLASYFDPVHLAMQDELGRLGDRTVTEDHDDGAVRKTTWRVTSLDPLPAIARPFVKGGKLSYLESMTWRRSQNKVELTVSPDILGGRVQIAATYTLVLIAPMQVKRTYAGDVTVNIKLLGGRIERGIVEAFDGAMEKMAAVTQRFLDQR